MGIRLQNFREKKMIGQEKNYTRLNFFQWNLEIVFYTLRK